MCSGPFSHGLACACVCFCVDSFRLSHVHIHLQLQELQSLLRGSDVPGSIVVVTVRRGERLTEFKVPSPPPRLQLEHAKLQLYACVLYAYIYAFTGVYEANGDRRDRGQTADAGAVYAS